MPTSWDPLSHPAQNKFILALIDDYSRYAEIYNIQNKSEAGDRLEKFIRLTQNVIGGNLKVYCVRADNAKEFTRLKKQIPIFFTL